LDSSILLSFNSFFSVFDSPHPGRPPYTGAATAQEGALLVGAVFADDLSLLSISQLNRKWVGVPFQAGIGWFFFAKAKTAAAVSTCIVLYLIFLSLASIILT
jgi:hypothetical protein